LRHVELVGSLRSITKCQYETSDKCSQVEKLEDDGKDVTRWKSKTFVGERCGQNAEDEEEVALVFVSAVHVIFIMAGLTIANQANSMLISW